MQGRLQDDSERPPAPGVSTRWLEACSGAVFAIAVTLLVLTCRSLR
jgi:hypothetical protein